MAELREVRRLVERLVPDPLTPTQRAVVIGLHAVFGGSAFTSAELARVLDLNYDERPPLREALLELAGNLKVQHVGIALRHIADAGGVAGNLRLTAPASERGGRVWCCEALRD